MVRKLLVASVLALTACTAAPRVRPVKAGPVDTGSGSLTEARKYLEGHWSLVSFDVFPPSGSSFQVQGNGSLDYDAYGNLSMTVRVDKDSAARLEAAGISARDGVVSTSGRTAVDLQNKTLTYVLEGRAGRETGPMALTRPRHWEVTGTQLTLTTLSDDGKPLTVGKWQKQ